MFSSNIERYQGKERASFGHKLTQELLESISTEFEKNSHGYKHNVVDQPVEWSVQKSQNLPYLMGTSVLECQDVSESLPFIVTDDNLASEQGGKYDGKPKFHCLVYNADTKAKYCVYCKIMGNRTSCGWNVRSYYCCDACDVPLCSGKRDCYNDYHKMLKKAQPDLTWLCSDLRPVKK
ncbi:unnamed protein product [Mytilus coruscus]|uniref:Uncharacterized protein n=1 Tax=Mytilus coruscus TaxID=42192 RepID=A0A6J8DPX3_MYTCO|nr:unnamed protein product [Mytilus coruscus]